ncbi:MAG: carboxypeptidase-like regulatory domain-containing protein [Pyrinomonadaceae bacterium]
MFRINRFVSLMMIIGILAFGSIVAFAQATSIDGVVQVKKDSTTPLEGVTVTCYNLKDFTESANLPCASATSDAEGKFSLTGLTAESSYVLTVSGPAIGARVTLPIKPGEKAEITVEPGDGKALSKVEVWNAFAYSPGSGGPTKEQKLAQAEYEKIVADVESKNAKIIEKTKIIQAALDAGNAAYNSGNMELAIAKYEEGIQADPEFIGSVPVLLNNKATAMKRRAVDNYNSDVRSSDNAVKSAAKDKATKDLSTALGDFDKSYVMLKNAPAAAVSEKENHKKNILNALDGGRDVIRIMAQLEVADPSKVEQAKNLTNGILEIETDKAKKGAAELNFGRYLMYAGDYEGAAAELKKALAFTSNDPDILAYLGLSLYTAGAINESRAQKQESLNYFDVFLKAAPKDHKLRTDIDAMVADLTTTEKLKPQKL